MLKQEVADPALALPKKKKKKKVLVLGCTRVHETHSATECSLQIIFARRFISTPSVTQH